jgi:hypothetical protein
VTHLAKLPYGAILGLFPVASLWGGLFLTQQDVKILQKYDEQRSLWPDDLQELRRTALTPMLWSKWHWLDQLPITNYITPQYDIIQMVLPLSTRSSVVDMSDMDETLLKTTVFFKLAYVLSSLTATIVLYALTKNGSVLELTHNISLLRRTLEPIAKQYMEEMIVAVQNLPHRSSNPDLTAGETNSVTLESPSVADIIHRSRISCLENIVDTLERYVLDLLLEWSHASINCMSLPLGIP